jgi:hypothetical protein
MDGSSQEMLDLVRRLRAFEKRLGLSAPQCELLRMDLLEALADQAEAEELAYCAIRKCMRKSKSR